MPDLRSVRENWEGLAQTDPLWAILSDPAKRGGGWDIDEFFASGVDDVERVLDRVATLGLAVDFGGTALDFGCGTGRLTQALATRFSSAIGVDISQTMVELARRYNRFPETCHYIANDRTDLSVIPDRSIDFIYTVLVLQHMHPRFARAYIAEFIRILKEGGVLVFELPTRPLFAGVSNPIVERVLHRAFRLKETLRSRKRLRLLIRMIRRVIPFLGGPGYEVEPYRMEMHAVPQTRVLRDVENAGARVVHIEPRQWTLPAGTGQRSPRSLRGSHVGWESAWFYVANGG